MISKSIPNDITISDILFRLTEAPHFNGKKKCKRAAVQKQQLFYNKKGKQI
jgi:hypothetical protein